MIASRLAIFTICSNNYIPAARTFFDSLTRQHRDAALFVCLVDEMLDLPGLYDPAWTVVEAAQLGITDFRCFAFRYDIMELNTAVKPFMFQHLFDTLGYDIVLYFDPDIEVFQPLDSVLGPLRGGASFVLTPHLCAPAPDETGPDDLSMMKAGIYNLGFLGVSRGTESAAILDWWAERLRYQCINAQERGIFVDQKFMDLVPGFAAGAHVSHDVGLNVAYWNLRQRRFDETAAGWEVDGKKLVFFHYSGFDPRAPDTLSKHDSTFGPMAPPLQRLTGLYRASLLANGHGKIPMGTYAYGRFASGVPIAPLVRQMFRDRHLAWPDDPFETFEAFLHEPAPGASRASASCVVTNFMRYLHDRFSHWHARIDLAVPAHVAELVYWYVAHAPRELRLDLGLVEPEAERLGARTPPRLSRGRPPKAPSHEVAVVGYLRTASGVGEVGRLTLRALSSAGVGVAGCDVALNVAAARQDESCAALLVETSSAPVQIYNVNADQLPLVVDHVRPRLAPAALRINIPFWELSRFPAAWLSAFDEMHEVWAPSRFIQTALAGRLQRPVLHMPVAHEFDPPPPLRRDRFALPERRFLFYYAFDFLSFMERKNPRAAIAAFRMAFPDRGTAGLVLKCMNGALAPEQSDAFRAEIAGDPDIFLIDETLSRADTLALMAATEAIISLHRSEGLGLLIAEAMILGKPVIATDYSASREFVTGATGYPVGFELVAVRDGEYPFPEGQDWASPDIPHAAWLMRRLRDAPERAAPMTHRAAQHLRENFSRAGIAKRQMRRLRMLTAT